MRALGTARVLGRASERTACSANFSPRRRKGARIVRVFDFIDGYRVAYNEVPVNR